MKPSPEERKAPRPEVALFYSRSADCADLGPAIPKNWRKRLSNFWPGDVYLDDPSPLGRLRFPSVEHCFQALKARRASDMPDMANEFVMGGRVGNDPKDAKVAGSRKAYAKRGATLDAHKWNACRDDIMRLAVCSRASCDGEFCDILRATKGMTLLHLEPRGLAHTLYWGGRVDKKTGVLVGENKLGKTLMEIREELLKA